MARSGLGQQRPQSVLPTLGTATCPSAVANGYLYSERITTAVNKRTSITSLQSHAALAASPLDPVSPLDDCRRSPLGARASSIFAGDARMIPAARLPVPAAHAPFRQPRRQCMALSLSMPQRAVRTGSFYAQQCRQGSPSHRTLSTTATSVSGRQARGTQVEIQLEMGACWH